MSELRWHPFRQEWVITATHRQDRTFLPPDDFCPLCPTKDLSIPTEIPVAAYDIAVFENRFPSLSSPASQPAIETSDIVPVLPSDGICEVVCYTDTHDATFADLPVRQIEKLIAVWRERYEHLRSLPQVKYVFIFENKGKEIGVTLTHPHGQIYAYPFVPRVVQARFDAEKAHFDRHGQLLQSDWLASELNDGRRIVDDFGDWISLVPIFARYPYEVHIVPREPACSIGHLTSSQMSGLAKALSVTTKRLDALFGFSMPYIMAQHNSEERYSSFCIEFTPPYRTAEKLKYLAGSEAVCGIFINDTLPEESAERLRQTQ